MTRVRRLVAAAWIASAAAAAGAVEAAPITITELPLPSPDSRPGTIVAGPDGALWFAEGEGNRIGRITVTGTLTEFPVPTPFGQPVGPDGNLWFTDPGFTGGVNVDAR